jgi:hypothetical protein
MTHQEIVSDCIEEYRDDARELLFQLGKVVETGWVVGLPSPARPTVEFSQMIFACGPDDCEPRLRSRK